MIVIVLDQNQPRATSELEEPEATTRAERDGGGVLMMGRHVDGTQIRFAVGERRQAININPVPVDWYAEHPGARGAECRPGQRVARLLDRYGLTWLE